VGFKKMREIWQSSKSSGNSVIAARLLAAAHEMMAEDIRINRRMVSTA